MSTIFKFHWRAIIWLVLIFVGCLLPGSDLPNTSFFSKIPYFDKIVHFGIYFVFILLLMAGFIRQFDGKLWKSILFSLTIALVCGALIEILQSQMHAGRTGDMYDMLANTSGAILGLLLFHPLRWILKNIL